MCGVYKLADWGRAAPVDGGGGGGGGVSVEDGGSRSLSSSPRHPPLAVSALAVLSTTYCIGARHVIHHM
jgi:hypothetical protein